MITGLRPKELARSLGHTTLRLMRRDSVPDAVRGSDIVTTVSADKTNSPKIRPDMIEPGRHINGAGGDCPGKTELWQVLRHQVPGRTSAHQVTLFDSVGFALALDA